MIGARLGPTILAARTIWIQIVRMKIAPQSLESLTEAAVDSLSGSFIGRAWTTEVARPPNKLVGSGISVRVGDGDTIRLIR